MRPYDWCHPGCPNPCLCQETIENKMRATKDGQAEGVEPGGQKASGVAPATTVGDSPVPPSACPCDGTDCACNRSPVSGQATPSSHERSQVSEGDGTDCVCRAAEYPPPCPHCGFEDCVC